MYTRIVMLIAAAALIALSACSREDFGGTSAKRDAAVEQELFTLARMNGCLECHTVTAAKLGPSWNEIAMRYKDAPREAARELLIDRVRNGSQGQYINWKSAEGMPPLKNRVSDAHIERLVDYILALRDPPP
jgi:cytochrome c